MIDRRMFFFVHFWMWPRTRTSGHERCLSATKKPCTIAEAFFIGTQAQPAFCGWLPRSVSDTIFYLQRLVSELAAAAPWSLSLDLSLTCLTSKSGRCQALVISFAANTNFICWLIIVGQGSTAIPCHFVYMHAWYRAAGNL